MKFQRVQLKIKRHPVLFSFEKDTRFRSRQRDVMLGRILPKMGQNLVCHESSRQVPDCPSCNPSRLLDWIHSVHDCMSNSCSCEHSTQHCGCGYCWICETVEY